MHSIKRKAKQLERTTRDLEEGKVSRSRLRQAARICGSLNRALADDHSNLSSENFDVLSGILSRMQELLRRESDLYPGPIERLIITVGYLLPRRRRDEVLGDALEAVAASRSQGTGRASQLAALFTGIYWFYVVLKTAIIFAVIAPVLYNRYRNSQS